MAHFRNLQEPLSPPLPTSSAPTPQPTPSVVGTLKDAIFTDLTVICGGTSIECNRLVVGRASKVVLKALTDPTTIEYQTSTFTIGHDFATEENVLLFVQGMYEGWLADSMDDHAWELLRLADCYECDQIAEWAVKSLKRKLTHETFWKTCSLGVLLDVAQPEVLDACVKYVKGGPNRLVELVQRDDKGDYETIAVMVIKMANSMPTTAKEVSRIPPASPPHRFHDLFDSDSFLDE